MQLQQLHLLCAFQMAAAAEKFGIHVLTMLNMQTYMIMQTGALMNARIVSLHQVCSPLQRPLVWLLQVQCIQVVDLPCQLADTCAFPCFLVKSLARCPLHVCATVHLGMQTDPYFTTQNHLEVPRPGNLIRARYPLEAAIRISPVLQLTNALPYLMTGYVISMGPVEPATTSSSSMTAEGTVASQGVSSGGTRAVRSAAAGEAAATRPRRGSLLSRPPRAVVGDIEPLAATPNTARGGFADAQTLSGRDSGDYGVLGSRRQLTEADSAATPMHELSPTASLTTAGSVPGQGQLYQLLEPQSQLVSSAGEGIRRSTAPIARAAAPATAVVRTVEEHAQPARMRAKSAVLRLPGGLGTPTTGVTSPGPRSSLIHMLKRGAGAIGSGDAGSSGGRDGRGFSADDGHSEVQKALELAGLLKKLQGERCDRDKLVDEFLVTLKVRRDMLANDRDPQEHLMEACFAALSVGTMHVMYMLVVWDVICNSKGFAAILRVLWDVVERMYYRRSLICGFLSKPHYTRLFNASGAYLVLTLFCSVCRSCPPVPCPLWI